MTSYIPAGGVWTATERKQFLSAGQENLTSYEWQSFVKADSTVAALVAALEDMKRIMDVDAVRDAYDGPLSFDDVYDEACALLAAVKGTKR